MSRQYRESLSPEAQDVEFSRPSELAPRSTSASGLAFFHAPVDLSTTLVQYWFTHICPMWSVFDSEQSLNRKLPSNTWTTSEPVFYALQAMSAASLAESSPQFSSMLPSLVTRATTTITLKLQALRNSPAVPAVNITVDLLFALCAIGTSLHWNDSSQFGDELLHDAKEVLGLWTMSLSAVDAMVHAYFHQALTYWQMLHTFVGRGPKLHQLDRRRSRYRLRLRKAMQFDHDSDPIDQHRACDGRPYLDGSRLHPWCGISSEVIDLFGQVLALCRSTRSKDNRSRASQSNTTADMLCDIHIARDLQNELLVLDFDAIVTADEIPGRCLQTGDEKTPITHLIRTAEAYRQASLIQLYLTFQDLDIEPTKTVTFSYDRYFAVGFNHNGASRTQRLSCMALQLTEILKTLPPDSGTRCIQPPLLIVAAAGLRMDSDPAILDTTSMSPQSIHMLPTCRANYLATDGSLAHPSITESPVTVATFEVAKARRFTKSRLRALQDTLPPRPIQVALDLVNAIWVEYDGSYAGSRDTHWLDIMNKSGCSTVFG